MEIKSVNLDQPYSSLDIYHSNTDKALPGLVILPGGSYNQIMERDSSLYLNYGREGYNRKKS